VSRRADGFSTPVHIVSKNQSLIDGLTEYGFTPGMTAASLEPSLRHEGIYSLLMRVLVEQYGADPVALPNYLPHGAEPEQLTQSTIP
jgi:hypothetical protein